MKKIFSILFLALCPLQSVFAAVTPTDFKSLAHIFTGLIQSFITVVFAITFIVVTWGIIKGWVIQGGDSEGVETGKKVVSAGVVALVIMSAIWGIVYILQSSVFGG